MNESKKQKKPGHRLRSKRGMSLVEILVGVTIMAMVFGATLSALVGGYTSTMNNASQNQAAGEAASVNEAIMQYLLAKNYSDPGSTSSAIFSTGTEIAADSPLYMVAKGVRPDIVYVKSGDPTVATNVFPDDTQGDVQFTIKVTASVASENIDTGATSAMPGIEVKTAINTLKGWVVVTSFVPYGQPVG